MTTIVFNGTVYTCTLSDRFRRHTRDELERMRESVAGPDGVRLAVWLYHDATLDLDDCVLDGEGRLSTAVAVGLDKVPFRYAGSMTTEQAYDIAKVLNDDRRQDSPEAIRQRRRDRVSRVAEARGEGKSLRAIAQAEEVSLGQVQRDLEEATVSGDTVETPERVTGLDGKSRPASRPVPEPEEPEEPYEASDEPEEPTAPPSEPTIAAVPDSRPSRAPSHFKPGYNGDPDHPFADVLSAMTVLVKVINAAIQRDDTGFLKANLASLTGVPVKQRHIAYGDDVWKPGGSSQAAKFVGLAFLRSVVRNSGTMKKKMTPAQLRKLCEQVGGAPDAKLITAEADDQ